ncbi:Serine/threonine-protein kinase PknB [Novipirellula artificiosorum]|uniref:Serine/threonine-protein kinase PknB n=2 Tax=Novipirellula artificiosorum TaxID=2528016 RepID=A0A5C6D4T5_9BACT|nr:Serine/threonine-protein kinase PknB [Novipirellula artificiosorum]
MDSICPQCLVRNAQKQSSADADLAATQEHLGSSRARFDVPSAEQLDALLPGIQVAELIGHGGMGAVYRGRQINLDRDVAIKILPREIQSSGQLGERFQREAQTLAKLHHPNIVSVFDFGNIEGLYYFVMEYVDGVTLRETIQSGSVTPDAALKMIPVICDALQFAHSLGVVHRDIKPENILIDHRGQIKIADFGLAKLVHRDEDAAEQLELTGTQQVMGTAKYMAPEQMTTSKTVDHRADIYSLGVVFYELLTGETPIGWFQPPSKKVAVDVRLDEVVLRTLESEPERRYQQVSEVKTAIENLSSSTPFGATLDNASKSKNGGFGSVQLHKLLDVTESHYRWLHSLSTIFGLGVLPVLGFVLYRTISPIVGWAVLVAAIATVVYSIRIKRHQVFDAEYKGHTIRLDNSGTFAEKLYLDDGLVRTGGFGSKMEFRFPIKAGEGTGDEIIVWLDAGFSTIRCRIEVESKPA